MKLDVPPEMDSCGHEGLRFYWLTYEGRRLWLCQECYKKVKE